MADHRLTSTCGCSWRRRLSRHTEIPVRYRWSAAGWYVGFAGNAITFAYTDKSKYARDVTPQNWYKVLARPGVEIGRSNPDTDPSGYQTLQMLSLAEKAYAARRFDVPA